MAARRSQSVWLLGLVAILIGAFLLRQMLVGDAAVLVANLWISTMSLVFGLFRPLFGF